MTQIERHRIRWYVYAGREMIPHTSHMRGQWGYDAKCSCGWQSRTGGGVRRWVRELVNEHKEDVHEQDMEAQQIAHDVWADETFG